MQSETVAIGQEKEYIGATHHVQNLLWEMINDQLEGRDHLDVVIQVAGDTSLLLGNRDLFNVLTCKHGPQFEVLLELGVKEAHNSVKSLFEVLNEAFVIVEDVLDKLIH